MPLIFYRAGKPIGSDLTDLRARYRSQLTSWLQGQAELLVLAHYSVFVLHLKKLNNIDGASETTGVAGGFSTSTDDFSLRPYGYTDYVVSCGELARITSLVHFGLVCFTSLASFEALLPVAGAFQHLGQVIASATRVGQLMEQKPEVTFPISGPAPTSQVALEVTGLSFTYPQQPLPVLQNISLSLAAGEHIALLGRTGCGKSTLLQLLTRAWDVNQGHIMLNGQPLACYDEAALRQMMTVVSQRVHIFSSTLRENLLLACPTASDEQLKKSWNK